MNEEYCRLIRDHYQKSAGDSKKLFETVRQIAQQIGWDESLNLLEKCVVEKRTSWLDRNANLTARTNATAVWDGYRLFYTNYLNLKVPEDGEIIEVSDRRIVTRWWNKCPTLEACQKLGLDTREICGKAYHHPVQIMLERVDPALRFSRNYEAIRPFTPYCEEIIELIN